MERWHLHDRGRSSSEHNSTPLSDRESSAPQSAARRNHQAQRRRAGLITDHDAVTALEPSSDVMDSARKGLHGRQTNSARNLAVPLATKAPR